MMFRRILGVSIASAAMLVGSIQASGKDWLDDFEKAKEEAVEQGRPILIDFSGSDWCGWCVKLDDEVFSKSAFKKYAKDELVLFLADFPRRKKLDKDTAAQNKKLMETYGVRGFPTVLLVDPEGKVIAKTGYKEGGPKAYVEHLKELLKDYEAPEPKEKRETRGKLERKSRLKDSRKR